MLEALAPSHRGWVAAPEEEMFVLCYVPTHIIHSCIGAPAMPFLAPHCCSATCSFNEQPSEALATSMLHCATAIEQQQQQRFRLRNKKVTLRMVDRLVPTPRSQDSKAKRRLRNAKLYPQAQGLKDYSAVAADCQNPDDSTQIQNCTRAASIASEVIIRHVLDKEASNGALDAHSDSETQLASDDESKSIVEEDEEESCVLDGVWNNRGVITGGMLTWQDGPSVPLIMKSSRSFSLVQDEVTYHGELQADGTLIWNDGDIWTRQPSLEGYWDNRGLISGSKLTWTDGLESPIVLTVSDATVELELDSLTHRGTLQADGKSLEWNDGDVWIRHVLKVGDRLKAHAGVKFMEGDVEYFSSGDEGVITRLDEETFDIAWTRSGRTSAYYVGSWTKAFSVAAEPSKFGFRMFAQVKFSGVCQDIAKGQQGNVVGFNHNLVEVKFKQGIFQCTPGDLIEVKTGMAVKARDSSSDIRKANSPAIAVSAKASSTRACAAKPLQAACGAEIASQPSKPSALIEAPRRVSAQATSPQVKSSSSTVAPPAAEKPLDSIKYHGIVTWSRGSMAWLKCDALAAAYPNCDVFLHKNDCGAMPKQSDCVSFRLALDFRGNPKAILANIVKLKPEPAIISARDWFNNKAGLRPSK
jgi:hypothetical protein